MIVGVLPCPWCQRKVTIPIERKWCRHGGVVLRFPSVTEVERAVVGHECQN